MSLALSVVIPAFNEVDRIGETLNRVLQYLNEQKWESELIVVDDGSTDETVKVAQRELANAGRVTASLIQEPVNRGKGHAVRRGLLASSGAVGLFSDADLSTPIEELPKLTGAIGDGYDIAFGSRALDRSLIKVRQPWRREQGGKVFNLFVRLATGLPYWDTQCGFKAFRMSSCRDVIASATIDRFAFDVELLYVASLAGLRLIEVPVRWDHNDGSKIDFRRDSMRMLTELARIRRQKAAGKYDLVLNKRLAKQREHSSSVRP
jgi:glycosyltransferase involved in cell wall biosynthesis